jgi:hypothetical protein
VIGKLTLQSSVKHPANTKPPRMPEPRPETKGDIPFDGLTTSGITEVACFFLLLASKSHIVEDDDKGQPKSPRGSKESHSPATTSKNAKNSSTKIPEEVPIGLLLKDLRKTKDVIQIEVEGRLQAEQDLKKLEEEVERLRWYFLSEGGCKQ